MADFIEFRINGKPVKAPSADGERLLLWHLRADLYQTGTKYGCGEGYCGSCTVLLNKKPVRSCGVLLKTLAGAEIITIEGIAQEGKLHPVQRAFIDHDALQCGYCTPGMILEAIALLEKSPNPTVEEIKQGMDEHLCRCGSYYKIVQAIQAAAQGVAHAGI